MDLEPPPGQRARSPKRPIEDQDGKEPVEGLEAGEEANLKALGQGGKMPRRGR